MNEDILKGKWTEIKGKLRQQWGKLTDNDISQINGTYEELSGRLQKIYGYQKDQAKREIDSFLEKHHFTETEK